MASYLLIIGERVALHWVVHASRVAFPPGRTSQARVLDAGDVLFLYTTRGAFHNPTRDRGRISGRVVVLEPPQVFADIMELAGLRFASGCRIHIDRLAPYRGGAELVQLVHRMPATFGTGDGWRARLRATLLPIAEADTPILEAAVSEHAGEPKDALADYPKPPIS